MNFQLTRLTSFLNVDDDIHVEFISKLAAKHCEINASSFLLRPVNANALL